MRTFTSRWPGCSSVNAGVPPRVAQAAVFRFSSRFTPPLTRAKNRAKNSGTKKMPISVLVSVPPTTPMPAAVVPSARAGRPAYQEAKARRVIDQMARQHVSLGKAGEENFAGVGAAVIIEHADRAVGELADVRV